MIAMMEPVHDRRKRQGANRNIRDDARPLIDRRGHRSKGLNRLMRKHRAKLLHRRPMPLTTDNIPVAADVFLHRLECSTVEALRRAVEQGLTPSGLDFTGDDDSVVILRFTRTTEVAREQRK